MHACMHLFIHPYIHAYIQLLSIHLHTKQILLSTCYWPKIIGMNMQIRGKTLWWSLKKNYILVFFQNKVNRRACDRQWTIFPNGTWDLRALSFWSGEVMWDHCSQHSGVDQWQSSAQHLPKESKMLNVGRSRDMTCLIWRMFLHLQHDISNSSGYFLWGHLGCTIVTTRSGF